MCGIVGYIGNKEAFPVLTDGLKKLEYRGYDSAGVALVNGSVNIYKKLGKVSDLESYAAGKNTTGNVGIGHTRWATHGEPSDMNAHPHQSQDGTFILVHNGIIENYAQLRKELGEQGFIFKSETDTEVLANLMEYFYRQDDQVNAEIAVQLALSKVTGAY
jgi:glutamine---fructose-6-phosphate transaminase (isomerizing)